MANYFDSYDQIYIDKTASKTKHAELFSAFEYGETITLRLRLPKLPGTAFLVMKRDEDGETIHIPGFHNGNEIEFTIRSDEICRKNLKRGLFFYCFLLDDQILSLSEDEHHIYFGTGQEPHALFQLTIFEPGTNRPTGYEGGIIYQIFPDRFSRSNRQYEKKGSVIESDWYADISEYSAYPGAPVANNHFFGGNLEGIADKAEYFKSIGVTLIYLNPIFRAASNHRYDTGDYMTVDELLGGEEALKNLIERMNDVGIGIILDGVFNHTGSDSLYFNKEGNYPSIGAYQSENSPYYPWYYFHNYPDSYESWWGISILPKVNGRDPSFKNFIAGKDGVIQKYLKMGIAGWRLDVVDELDDEIVDAIRNAVDEVKDHGIVYGEVWEDASNKIAYSKRRRYFSSGQLNGVMNYPLKNAIITYLTDGNAEVIAHTQRSLYEHYPKAASDMQMNLLSSHDTERILNMLAGNPHRGWSNCDLEHARLDDDQRSWAIKLLRMAVVLQMFLPGIPMIYYGDEIGMEGDHDPFNRQTYKWGREDKETLSFYRNITALRRSLPMLKDAYYRSTYAKDGVFVFERFNDSQRLLVALNRSDSQFVISDQKYGHGQVLHPEICRFSDTYVLNPNDACCILFNKEI